jgi:DNA primase
MIKPHVVEHLKKKYKKVITFFDNDTAGSLAIDKYKTLYNLDGFALPLSKDISDSMREHGFDIVHQTLKPLLKEILNR